MSLQDLCPSHCPLFARCWRVMPLSEAISPQCRRVITLWDNSPALSSLSRPQCAWECACVCGEVILQVELMTIANADVQSKKNKSIQSRVVKICCQNGATEWPFIFITRRHHRIGKKLSGFSNLIALHIGHIFSIFRYLPIWQYFNKRCSD